MKTCVNAVGAIRHHKETLGVIKLLCQYLGTQSPKQQQKYADLAELAEELIKRNIPERFDLLIEIMLMLYRTISQQEGGTTCVNESRLLYLVR